jgi:hypothetical protein
VCATKHVAMESGGSPFPMAMKVVTAHHSWVSAISDPRELKTGPESSRRHSDTWEITLRL